VGHCSVDKSEFSLSFLLYRSAVRSPAMITYGKKAELMGSTRRNSHLRMGSLQVSSPRWHYVRGLCEVVRIGGSDGVAQAARESGSVGFGHKKTALGEIASTGFEFEEATCRGIWFDVFSTESIGLHSTAVNAPSLLLIFSSRACRRSVVTVRLACIIATSRDCTGSPIVFWRED
jgi:hypothetical protein